MTDMHPGHVKYEISFMYVSGAVKHVTGYAV